MTRTYALNIGGPKTTRTCHYQTRHTQRSDVGGASTVHSPITRKHRPRSGAGNHIDAHHQLAEVVQTHCRAQEHEISQGPLVGQQACAGPGHHQAHRHRRRVSFKHDEATHSGACIVGGTGDIGDPTAAPTALPLQVDTHGVGGIATLVPLWGPQGCMGCMGPPC
jgi:hypothetical protein